MAAAQASSCQSSLRRRRRIMSARMAERVALAGRLSQMPVRPRGQKRMRKSTGKRSEKLVEIRAAWRGLPMAIM